MNQPKLLILGHGEHGKGTVSKILCKHFGHTAASSSELAFPYIYPALKRVHGYLDKAAAIADKRNQRLLWKELITLLNEPDKTTLTRLILANHTIYDGMRCPVEFAASKHLFDAILWVDASERKPYDKSMGIPFDFTTMWYIDNNGSEKALQKIVEQIYSDHIDPQ